MFLGYQKGKIKFYTEKPLDLNLYNIDRVEETELEYVLKNDEYVIKDSDYENWLAEEERKRINSLSLTKREVLLAIYKDKGITPEQIKSNITAIDSLIEFEYATEYFRGNPLIDQIGLSLGYSQSDIDYLFEHKTFPNK